ncbi:MAG: hypothetical protein ACUVXI_15825 [bacterium]
MDKLATEDAETLKEILAILSRGGAEESYLRQFRRWFESDAEFRELWKNFTKAVRTGDNRALKETHGKLQKWQNAQEERIRLRVQEILGGGRKR